MVQHEDEYGNEMCMSFHKSRSVDHIKHRDNFTFTFYLYYNIQNKHS